MNKTLKNRIDWVITLIPFLCIVALCLTFFTDPAGSSAMVDGIRAFLGEEFGWYYLTLGLGIFLITLYMAFSRFGNIHLGEGKAQYSLFNWGAMMFTAGIAADILFYSLCEWMIYANEPHVLAMGSIQDWSGVFALFHWGPIPWAFYMALAVAFGFMIHVRKRNRQKYSEACRPLLGNLTDRWAGKLVDLLAVFALIAGTATTFSVSAPLLSNAVTAVFGIPDSTALSITILLVICILYTICAWFGIDGVSWMASACIWLFFALLAFVLVAGGMPRYILETGLANIGKVAQNFIEFSTGLTGWCGASRHRSSSAASAAAGPSARSSSADTPAESEAPGPPLSSSGTTDSASRPAEKWIFLLFMRNPACMTPSSPCWRPCPCPASF